MIDRNPQPQDLYVHLVRSFRLSRAVWLAAHFRLPDVIGDGPATAAAIAGATGTDVDAMTRLMDALTAAGLFQSAGPSAYGPTPTSDFLRSDHPKSQRALIDLTLGGRNFEAWGAIETTVRTGQTAFDSLFGSSWIDYYSEHPEAARAFAEAMTSTVRAFEDAILEADALPPFHCAVDIGGSHGGLLQRLLEQNPEADGILFDLPDVITDWSIGRQDNLGNRLTGVGGDFFERVPGGGDLYLLKSILHDWSDAKALTILERIREAALAHGKLALIEVVLPEPGVEHSGWMMDLNMMVITGGRERNAQQYTRLLTDSGWQLDRIVPTRSPLSIILATPAER